jgi:RNA-binding protein 39
VRACECCRYIEFYDAMDVPMAIALSGQYLLGQPVMVKPSEAEKNLVQSTASGGTTGVVGPYGAVDRKLYVGNLHFNMTETHLREVLQLHLGNTHMICMSLLKQI